MLKLSLDNTVVQAQPAVGKQLKESRSEDAKKIIDELKKAKMELESANQNFEFATEPLLIDMYAYQIKAAQAKYSYLIGIIRKTEIENKGYLEDTFYSKVVY